MGVPTTVGNGGDYSLQPPVLINIEAGEPLQVLPPQINNPNINLFIVLVLEAGL
jgi:hypothetical protein